MHVVLRLRAGGGCCAQRSLQMLMEFAVGQKHTQFILLTPLDMTAITHVSQEVRALC
jgi:hypothetical protein